MKLINILLGIGLTGLTLFGMGCGNRRGYSGMQEPAVPKLKNYFSNISSTGTGGVALTNGDFDGDGDLDVIFATSDGHIHFLENDGKGNFTLRQYSNPIKVGY